MNHNAAIDRYRKVEEDTVSKGELLVRLYEGTIRYINQAEEQIAKKNFAAKGERLNRALDIISTLEQAIDDKASPDLAKKLRGLYKFIRLQIFTANRTLAIQPLEDSKKILNNLLVAWRQSLKKN